MVCLSITKTSDRFTVVWFGTAMYNFDYFQATEVTYSASNNKVAFTVRPSSYYGNTWQNDTISSNPWKTHFSRSIES